ncbi:MAG TPA: cation transporter [Hyphomonadaceae bacterium]|nr:cation transporter [Hyphomonadaceae bacterium]
MQWRAIFLITGAMTAFLGALMLPCILIDLAGASPTWRAFALSAFLAGVLGAAMAVSTIGGSTSLDRRSAFFLTAFIWMWLPLIGALPFMLTGFSFTNAYFEAMSGLTTTGATVITGLDAQPRGLLLWRALMQGFGGIGIIVVAIAVLPILRVGGMQLMAIESSDTSDKILPRATEIAGQTTALYLVLVGICALAYAFAGMNGFEAITHALTTMSTGGFSTKDASMGGFAAGGADLAAIPFMLIAALPFSLLVLAARGDLRTITRDDQVRSFLVITALAILAVVLYRSGADLFEADWRNTAFSVVSVVTGTGYATADYALWGPFVDLIMMILMILGACAGSAACGLKVFRLRVMIAAMTAYAKTMFAPNRVMVVRYAGRNVALADVDAVLLYATLYVVAFAVGSAVLAFCGLDLTSAASAAASAMGCVGPGLGPLIGPASTYQAIPDAAKWVASLLMLIGRLEIFPVLLVLSPFFWRR